VESDRNSGQPRAPRVREAVAADLPAVAEIYRDAFAGSARAGLGRRTTRRYFEGLLRAGACRLLVAEKQGEVSGFAVLVVSPQRLPAGRWLLCAPGVWLEGAALISRRPGLALAYLRRALRARFSREGAAQTPTADAAHLAGLRTAWVELIAVSAAERGKGLGSRFLAAVVDMARDMGFECVKLSVEAANTGARRFYEREGFVRTAQSGRRLTYARECV